MASVERMSLPTSRQHDCRSTFTLPRTGGRKRRFSRDQRPVSSGGSRSSFQIQYHQVHAPKKPVVHPLTNSDDAGRAAFRLVTPRKTKAAHPANLSADGSATTSPRWRHPAHSGSSFATGTWRFSFANIASGDGPAAPASEASGRRPVIEVPRLRGSASCNVFSRRPNPARQFPKLRRHHPDRFQRQDLRSTGRSGTAGSIVSPIGRGGVTAL